MNYQFVLPISAIAFAATLSFAAPQSTSTCECSAGIGSVQFSPFAGNAPANCYPLTITVDVFIEVLDDGACADVSPCPTQPEPCTFAYDLKITGSAPCRIGVALDDRLLGAGWLGTGGALLLCVYDQPNCGEGGTLQAVYGLNATPLFSIQHTCETCQ
jgi:hypothetical protein